MIETISVSRVTTPVLSDRTCPLARFRDFVFIMATVSCIVTTFEVVPGVFVSEFLLLLAGSLSFAMLIATRGMKMRLPIHWSVAIFVAGMACACLSIIVNGAGLGEIRAFISHWVLRSVLVLAAVLVFVDSARARQILGCSSALVVVVTAALVCLFVAWTGDLAVLRRSESHSLQGLEWIRTVTGVGNGNANRIARVVLVLLPIAVWSQRHSSPRMMGLLLCAGVVMVLCRSRVGLLLYGFQIVAFLTLMMPRRHLARFLLVSIMLAVGVMGVQQVRNRMGDTGISDSPLRATLAEVSVSLIADRPLVGHGAGEAPSLINRHPRIQEELAKPGKPPMIAMHNQWLSLSLEYGIPAATLYLMVPLLLVIEGMGHGMKSRGPDRQFAFALAVSTWTILIAMQFGLIFRLSVLWIVIGAIIAVLGGATSPRGTRRLGHACLATGPPGSRCR
ncbi:O-antigen ligase family protein [bacterium]|nr:O-antigen ligase family protein [bacterium]